MDTEVIVTGLISGLDIRYQLDGAPNHPLLGARLPGIQLCTGLGLLLESGGHPPLGELAAGWKDRVDHTPGTAGLGAEAVLARPDGYACWAGPADPDQLGPVLNRWFGRPSYSPKR